MTTNTVPLTTRPPEPTTSERLAEAIMRLAEEDRGLVRSKLVEVIETCLYGFKGGPLPQDFRLNPACYVTVNDQGQISKANTQAGGVNLFPTPPSAEDWRRWFAEDGKQPGNEMLYGGGQRGGKRELYNIWINERGQISQAVEPPAAPSPTECLPDLGEPQLHCDTCNNTGEAMAMVCYGGRPVEKMGPCPDCSEIRKA